jgi:pimeloyl-ACP methyl ester carboxylesterase
VDRPETKYARSNDLMIAYQVTGEGNPVDLVLAPGVVSHLDLDWEDPEDERWIEQVSSYCRFIRFDKRGTGLSDRGVYAATLEERTDDIRAVMDAAGSERAVVFGISEGGCMACVFAATYPGRTRGMLLWGTMPRWVRTEGYPWGFDRDEHARFVADSAEQGMTVEYLTGEGAGMTHASEEELADAIRYCRAAASPTQMAALERMNQDMDIRDILPTIGVPTLILNRTGDPVAPIEAVRYMAGRIPGARLIEFPGDTHGWSVGPEDDEINGAIQGVRPAPRIDRVLTTVLFTDIINSTEKVAEIGDASWKGLLRLHHEHVRRQLAAHQGVERDTAGDGFFATFDGPARAVRCAPAIGSALRELGLEIRAGVHTGEVELTGEGVQGIAVHIGARVAAIAGPSEVVASSTVKDLVAGSGIKFEDAGEHELKGVPDRWRLYRVLE